MASTSFRRLLAALAWVLVSRSTLARADGGAWMWFEYRLPIVGEHTGVFPRLSLRLWTDTRLMADAGGLAQQFLRVGPLFDVTPWLYVAVHGTIYADRRPDASFEQEARLEIEPNFAWRVGRFTFNDRNRLEYRWRQAGARVRYRNQFRVNYAPRGARWIPFVWDEWLFDLGAGFSENRLAIGLGRMLNTHIRLEAAYVLRSRDLAPVPAWQHDHVGVLFLSVGLPPRPN